MSSWAFREKIAPSKLVGVSSFGRPLRISSPIYATRDVIRLCEADSAIQLLGGLPALLALFRLTVEQSTAAHREGVEEFIDHQGDLLSDCFRFRALLKTTCNSRILVQPLLAQTEFSSGGEEQLVISLLAGRRELPFV